MVAHLADAIALLYNDNRVKAKNKFRSPLLATALCGGQAEDCSGDSEHDAPDLHFVCVKCRRTSDKAESDPYPNLLKWAKRQVYEEPCWSCLPDTTLEEWMNV